MDYCNLLVLASLALNLNENDNLKENDHLFTKNNFIPPGDFKDQWGMLYGRLKFWNPIINNEDCSILEMSLLLNITWDVDGVSVGGSYENYADHYGDRLAAKRMAATKAAGELGKILYDLQEQ